MYKLLVDAMFSLKVIHYYPLLRQVPIFFYLFSFSCQNFKRLHFPFQFKLAVFMSYFIAGLSYKKKEKRF